MHEQLWSYRVANSVLKFGGDASTDIDDIHS